MGKENKIILNILNTSSDQSVHGGAHANVRKGGIIFNLNKNNLLII
jgi:hypothetical protein